jgi:hypothetical protein
MECLGVPADKIRVTYNGVDESFKPLAKNKDELQRRYKIDKKFFFSLGLVPRKD